MSMLLSVLENVPNREGDEGLQFSVIHLVHLVIIIFFNN